MKKLVIFACLAIPMMLFAVSAARAANTITVTSLADDGGAGELRAAIVTANSDNAGDTVTFQSALSGTITLTSALPTITNAMTIEAPANSAIVVDGFSTYRPFNIDAPGSEVAIQNLTIQNGSDEADSDGGAGILVTAGNVSVSGCTLTGNSATIGGALCNGDTLTGINCTLAGNSASSGGAVYNQTGGSTTLVNCTVTSNTASDAGALFDSGGTVNLTNCVMYGDTAVNGECDVNGLDTASYCDIEGFLEYGLTDNGNNIDQDPLFSLAGLANNGGPTQTIALQSGSLCFSAGTSSSAPATDQRGQPRPPIPSMGAFDVGPVAQLSVTVPGSSTAGAPFSVTVTALDAEGDIVTSYTGTVGFTSTDTASGVALPSNYTFVGGDAGVHTFTSGATLVTAGTTSTITATDTGDGTVNGTSSAIAVNAAEAESFTVTAASPQTAGNPFDFTVTAYDDFGNVATGYTGTVGFTSSDTAPGVSLPANYTFVGGDAGVHTFTSGATLVTASTTSTITATDTGDGTITGTSSAITVNAAEAESFTVTAASPQTAGNPFDFTVTAYDDFGNVATGYTGTVGFTSTDTAPGVSLPANYTFVGGDAGVHTFTSGATLVTASTTSTITATDTGDGTVNGTSGSITVNAAEAESFTVTAASPQTAGNPFDFTVTAYDEFGNVATGYTGTVGFTSTDTASGVALPSNYTFVGGDAGVHTFTSGATLVTASTTSTITATDTGDGTINGTSGSIAVNAAEADSFTVIAASPQTAGNPFDFTVTAYDDFGNVAAGYTGTVGFTSTDTAPGVALPSNYTFVGGDAGVHTFTSGATLVTASTTSTITATDTGDGSVNGTSGSITVNATEAESFTVTAASPQTAGNPFDFTVTAYDDFGNVATGYTGTVGYTSTDTAPGVSLPANYTFVGGDAGVHTFTSGATLVTASTTSTITATDTGDGTVNGTSSAITVNAAEAESFTVTAASPQTAGNPFDFTVTAYDDFGNVATGYTGTVGFTSTDTAPGVSLPANYTFVGGDAGVHTFTSGATLVTAGTTSTIAATDTGDGTITGTTSAITVNAAEAESFTVTAASPQTAGNPFDFTVTAYDDFGNVATGYTGTVGFTSTDTAPGVSLPANYTFVGGDAGVHTFTSGAILVTAGTTSTITATDTGDGTITGTSSAITVNAAEAESFTVTAASPQTAGNPFDFTVTAYDDFGNVATGYTGTVGFTSTDTAPGVSLPANYTFVGGDAGVHTFTSGATLVTASTTSTITATDTGDGSVNGTSGSITVNAAEAESFTVTAASPQTAGNPFDFTVTAYDDFGNVATGYTGTVGFTSTDTAPGVSLPANYTFVGGDAGVHTFTSGATLVTASTTSTITATDTGDGTVNGTSSAITVNAAEAESFTVTAASPQTAGNPFDFTVTAYDDFGNVASGYTGTVGFTSTDTAPGVSLPANYTFVGGDAGVHTFTSGATLVTASTTSTITATDTGDGTVNGTSGSIMVNAAEAESFTVTAASPQTAGNPFDFTVTAYDDFGNVATGYTGTVGFTSTDTAPGVSLPANYTFVGGDAGVHTFTSGATLVTASTTSTITATDTGDGSVNGTSGSIAVNAAEAESFTVTAASPQTAGNPFDFTVTAYDDFGNVATGYTGTVGFTSSDTAPGVSLPANYAFVGGDAGVHTFTSGATLVTASTTSTITATDTGDGTVNGISSAITVNAAEAESFTVTAASPQTAGNPFDFTVTAYDDFGNVATGYTGTVGFTSTDTASGVALPSNYTFVGGDAGVHTFTSGATLVTASTTSTITATDTGDGTVNGTSGSITVNAAEAESFTVTAASPQTAGNPFDFTVTAYDDFGNVATGYTGTVGFTSTDTAPGVSLPANYTFVGGDAGVHTFTSGATLVTASTTSTITATDTGDGSVNGTSGSIAVNAAEAESFTVTAASPQTAGNPFDFTVTAYDDFGNVATGYTGTVGFTSSDTAPGVSLPSNYTFVGGDAGVHTFTSGATLVTASTTSTITATDTGDGSVNGTSGSIAVNAAEAESFTVTAASPQTAGNPFDFTVTAYDDFGNVATGYTGTVGFTSSDTAPGVSLPANYAFVGGDAGVHTFTSGATLVTASTTSTITATDTGDGTVNGTSSAITVNAAEAESFTVTAASPQTAGNPFDFTVTAYDGFGNVATGYTGTVGFTSTDTASGVALPSNYTFVGGDAGVHTFTSGATLVTASTTSTITATDTGDGTVNGTSGSITVNAAEAESFTVTAASPQTAGNPFDFTVTAYDDFGNVATGYTGTVGFTSTDTAPGVSLPANYTFVGGDAGVHTFTSGATLVTASTTSTITATDTGDGSVNGTSGSIAVNAAEAESFTVTAASPQTAGNLFDFTVTAYDDFGNVATGYTGTVGFTSSDTAPGVSLPSNYTFVGGDAGVHTFTSGATLVTASTTSTITATDTGDGSVNGTSGSIAVNAAEAESFTVTAASPQTAGNPFDFTVTAYDDFGNVATGYTGTVGFTSSDTAPGVSLPANYAFVGGDAGVHTFTSGATLVTASTTSTITATDTGDGTVNGTSSAITVNAAEAESFTVTAASPQTAGNPFDFTVTAYDGFGNVATGYTGTVGFTSSDTAPGVSLPANYAFVGGDAGVHTFTSGATLVTSGTTSTITATDTDDGSVNGTSSAITVNAANATKLTVTAPANATAGTAVQFQVTANDAYGNIATGYTGTVHFTSTDMVANLPLDSTLSNGATTFEATLNTVGSQTITGTDTQDASVTGASGGIIVSAPVANLHVLWNNTDGTAAIFNVASDGSFTSNVFGPYDGWSAASIATEGNGNVAILWTNTNGSTALWDLNPTTWGITSAVYGPYAGWTPVGLTSGSDSHVHVLWTYTDGTAAIWDMPTIQSFSCAEFGPYDGWQPSAISEGGDGDVNLLWNNTGTGQVSVWDMPTATTFTAAEYGPYPGWSSNSIASGPDSAIHLLWSYTDGTMATWDMPDVTGFTSDQFGPFADWQSVGITIASDDDRDILWNNTSTGAAAIWEMPTATSFACTIYGPYTGWTAASISAQP